jgi:hypothetical protein
MHASTDNTGTLSFPFVSDISFFASPAIQEIVLLDQEYLVVALGNIRLIA